MTDAEVTELFNSICNERGGIDRLSVTEAAIAKGLAQCLATEPIDPGLIASLTAQLPPVVKRYAVHSLNVRFIDHFNDELQHLLKSRPDLGANEVITKLAGRITELETENKNLTEQVVCVQRELEQLRRGVSEPAAEIAHYRPSVSNGELLPPAPTRALPKPKHSDVYAVLAEVNRRSSGSPYCEPDVFDKFGRRLDADGLPASRRQP
jgi:hypothetical protein